MPITETTSAFEIHDSLATINITYVGNKTFSYDDTNKYNLLYRVIEIKGELYTIIEITYSIPP